MKRRNHKINSTTVSTPKEPPVAASWVTAGVLPSAEAPYPFAGQELKRQKRKHESIRGSEARVVRTGGTSNYTGIVPLFQLENATKAFESLIERDFWVVLDYEMRDVTQAKAQPGSVEIIVLGKTETWFPDMWIRRDGCRDLLVECKPAAILHPDPEKFPVDAAYMQARVAAMKVAADAMGMDFEIYTEMEVRLEPRNHNARMMRRGLSAHIPPDVLTTASRLLANLPPTMTVREFSKHLGNYAGAAMAIACCLDRLGRIELDAGAYFLPDVSFTNKVAN